MAEVGGVATSDIEPNERIDVGKVAVRLEGGVGECPVLDTVLAVRTNSEGTLPEPLLLASTFVERAS